jgi:RHS repeat-associated protein
VRRQQVNIGVGSKLRDGNRSAAQRYYTSVLGRFMTPDLVPGQSKNPQSWNRYAYAASDPANFSDPTGLFRGGPPMYEIPDPGADPSGEGGGGGWGDVCPIGTYFDAGTAPDHLQPAQHPR